MWGVGELRSGSEDEAVCLHDINNVFLDTSPIVYASTGIVEPPHIKEEAKQVIVTLSTETLDPRTMPREALEDIT